MKLQFDANQDYQLEAINSIVEIFAGQPLEQGSFEVISHSGQQEMELGQQRQILVDDVIIRGNKLVINPEQIIENVHSIQRKNGIKDLARVFKKELMDDTGDVISDHNSDPILTSEYDLLQQNNNFTVEMETGTGKTYVYLRTIHELYRVYGFNKFIIVVPSVAIREGVLKNLEITREHFASLYGNPRVNFNVWNPKKRGQAKQFATSDALEIMVINIDSFAKNENIIRQSSDWGVPLDYLQATNPIVIADEPQNLETEKRKQAIADLKPLATLRYSATHRELYNLMYKLDPVKAYDLGLVKKIEVDSIVSAEAYNDAYLKLIKIDHKNKSTPMAHIEVDKSDERGLQRKVLKVESGDNLEQLTRREIYSGYVLDAIDVTAKSVTFSNHKTLSVGEENAALREEILKYQIRRTIENHFEKELLLRESGIKVLTLFFIDKVLNYREYTASGPNKGKFALWFEEAFEQISKKPEYADLIPFKVDEVHDGYFSADKAGGWKDTKGNTKADDDTYELIMKDKERLLDAKEPLRFIFSHSALREGWDNPNVFQICTLREINKDVERRQTIGRGLRLPVNDKGERVKDEAINVLSVIANETYEDFAKNLQTEMEEQTGVQFGKGRIKEKSKRRVYKARKNITLNEDFKQLWERIKHKTRYHVSFSTQELVEKVTNLIQDEITIRSPKITSTKTSVVFGEKGIESGSETNTGIAVSMEFPVPDVVGKISSHTGITRQTVFEILKASDLIYDILRNPQQVIEEVGYVIRQVMQELNIDGIKYKKTGEAWEMQRFENAELSGYLFDEAANQGLVEVNEKKTTHNFVAIDSDIEKGYLEKLEKNSNVSFYCKLPNWFKIDTPLGGYNPDWAVVLKKDEKVYFVSETKSVNKLSSDKLKPTEKAKIRAGRKHFEELGVNFIAPTNSLEDTLDKL